MKCSGSPIICTAANVVRPQQPHDAAKAFETLLFRLALEPLARPLGFFGDVVIDAAATAISRSR